MATCTAMRPSGDPSSQPAVSTSSSKDVPTQKPPDVSILRVSQIDAGRLDGELTSLLREQFLRIFTRVRPGAVAAAAPELNLGLDLLVFYHTVWSHKPTPGMALMNLRYRDERKHLLTGNRKSGMEGSSLSVNQRLFALLAFVGTRYAWAKATRMTSMNRWTDHPESTWRHRAWRVMNALELTHSALSLVNLLAFLKHGKYRSPWERLARARLVYAAPNESRVVSFEYLNRQLVWQELSEIALFVLPIIGGHAQRWRDWSQGGSVGPTLGDATNALGDGRTNDSTAPNASGNSSQPTPHYVSLDTPCVACASVPCVNPFKLEPCRHVHCYYCARSRQKRDGEFNFRCAECGAKASGMRRVAVKAE